MWFSREIRPTLLLSEPPFLSHLNTMEQGRGILALPVEVMGMVVGHFCPHCAGAGLESMDSAHAELQGTLVALSRVNSRIGRAAQQTLFHVVLTGRNSLPKLLRTLMEQPAFASYIRVVDLGAFAGNHDSVWSYLDRQGAKKLWALACSAASGLPFSALPGVVEAYRTGSTWAVPPWGECVSLRFPVPTDRLAAQGFKSHCPIGSANMRFTTDF